MSQKRTYTHYKEFKEEAVALVVEQGYSVPDAAKSLGVSTKQISYAIAPLFHDGRFRKVERLPLGVIIVKLATGDRQMNMSIPFQVTTKGMQSSEDTSRIPSFLVNV